MENHETFKAILSGNTTPYRIKVIETGESTVIKNSLP